MPTYEYLCTDQGHRLEVVQRFTDDALTVCPECGGHLRKVISPVGIVFKGSGFYRNDSRAGAKGSSGAKESSIPAKDGASSSPASSSGDSGSSSSGDGGSSSSPASTPAGTSSGSGSGSNGSGSSGSGSGSSGSGSNGSGSSGASGSTAGQAASKGSSAS